MRLHPAFLVLTLALVAGSPARAGDLLFVGEDGRVQEREGSAWREPKQNLSKDQDYARAAGTRLGAHGETRVTSDGAVEFRLGRGAWERSPLRPPPGHLTYRQAHLGQDGSLFVEMGGGGQGFNYVGPGGRPVVLAIRMGWEDGSTGPKAFERLVANPAGPGLLALQEDGSVLRVIPGTPFRTEPYLPAGTAADLLDTAEGPVVQTRDHALLYLPQREGGKPRRVELPGPGRLASAAEPGALARAEQLKTSFIEKASRPAAHAALPPPARPVAELEGALAERRALVEEFDFLRHEAERMGVRAYLFGGTASAYAHYVKWHLDEQNGGHAPAGKNFDYRYESIFRPGQDLDIVIDGNPAQAHALSEKLQEAYKHRSGGRSLWEVRLLNQDLGDKQALLGNPDFANQHTDSASTGLIELTEGKKGEPLVRDVRDWNAKDPYFLRDVREGKLHYYFSPSHETTKFAREGKNPPIISAIRYLAKAFQYGTEMRPEDLEKIRAVIEAFDPRSIDAESYAGYWIEKNARKLREFALDPARARATLDDLGLRKKLIAIRGDQKKAGTLAALLADPAFGPTAESAPCAGPGGLFSRLFKH